MPELPDVEIYRRRAAASTLHKNIERIHISDERLLDQTTPQALGRQLHGCQFQQTMRHGKYLLLVSHDRCLVLHFGMTGDLQVVDGDPMPPYTRGEFHFANDGCLAYQSRRLLGQIFVVDDLDDLIAKKTLGPDALNIDQCHFCHRLGNRKGSLKAALMDQSLIAGIGNVYSDEILFQCQLHPTVAVPSLDRSAFEQLHDRCQAVLRTAIRHHADPDDMPSQYLLPHRGRDGHCPRCESSLRKVSVSGRHAIICPNCQVA